MLRLCKVFNGGNFVAMKKQIKTFRCGCSCHRPVLFTEPPMISARIFNTSGRNWRPLQDQMARHTEQMHHRMDSLSSDIAIHDAHMKLYNDVFFRKDEETPHEMRKRFFRSLPGADEPFRTFQLANAKLLHRLEDICREQHLDYWLWVGSLVGAASRSGPIPWDDDIDICMMREDAMKLYDLLKSDPEYQITLVYDYYAFVKQFRFQPQRLQYSVLYRCISLGLGCRCLRGQ